MRKPLATIWVGRCRLPRCHATRTRWCGSTPRISTRGSGAATTSISLPSSSTNASPPRSATAFSRSSRNSSPRVPTIAIRRRCRSSKSSTTVSAAAWVQRCCGWIWVARIMGSELLHLAVAEDLDHRRRRFQWRGKLAPDFHVRRLAMGIEVVAAFPALHHHEQVGIVDAAVALVGDTALLLAGRLDLHLGTLDEIVARFRLHLRGGDNIDHASSSVYFFA